jgi:hypothetical protein
MFPSAFDGSSAIFLGCDNLSLIMAAVDGIAILHLVDLKHPDKIEHGREPGADPTTSGYNASAVKIYNATSSLVRFQNKNISLYF